MVLHAAALSLHGPQCEAIVFTSREARVRMSICRCSIASGCAAQLMLLVQDGYYPTVVASIAAMCFTSAFNFMLWISSFTSTGVLNELSTNTVCESLLLQTDNRCFV